MRKINIFHFFEKAEKCKLFLLLKFQKYQYGDFVNYEGHKADYFKIVEEGIFNNV